MKLWKRIIIILLVSVSCIGCDQSTKILADEYLPKNGMISYLNDTFRIGYTENIGSFLGAGSDLSSNLRFWLFVVFVGLVLVGLLIHLLVSSKHSALTQGALTGLTLAFSGGVSNFYDRLINNGAVIDFLNVGIGSLRTGIFNIADMAIMLGIALIVYASFKGSGRIKHDF